MILSPRQQDILIKTLELYIATGAPVGSNAMAESVNASSSTIRAELSTLESLGYLTHPHASAGRIPTDAGYRYYVDTLIREGCVKTGHFQAPRSYSNVDELLMGVSEGMSQVTRLLAVVAGPGALGDAVSYVDYVTLRSNSLLFIVSMESGAVSSAPVTLPEKVEEGELKEILQVLNEWLGGRYQGGDWELDRAARKFLTDYDPALVQAVLKAVETLSRASERGVFIQGASALMARLDDLDPSSLAAVIEIFERRRWLLHLIGSALQRSVRSSDVVVSIGAESGFYKMANTSFIAAAYKQKERPYGVVSLIGPKRMDYDAAISTVRSAAETLTDYLSAKF